MNTITYSQRYLPHELQTKFYAVKLYRTGVSVSFVCRRYHISKSSLMRWNKNLMAQRNPFWINHTALIPGILTLTPMRNWNGFRIITGATRISLSANSMENFALPKDTPAIRVPYTAFIDGWATRAVLHLPKRNASHNLTILHLSLASNGRWM